MKLQWKSSPLDCLLPVLRQTQQRELTQEMKLPENLPDIGSVIGAWGQGIVRSKQWQADTVSCSGGVMVWVLYAPEDGSQPRVLDGWIPFQMNWDLPEDTGEGNLSVECTVRFVDARSVSPRKIMLRVGAAATALAMVPTQNRLWQPDGACQGVELLRSAYPMRLMKEAGEKAFQLEEELPLPEGAEAPEKILCCTLNPWITDKKVLSQRLVFRGTANLHILAESASGQVESWDFDVPFSQFTELEGSYGPEAQVEFQMCVTALEAEPGGQGYLKLKCGLVGQYRITDRTDVEVVEDAYCTARDLQIQWQIMELPVLLETKRLTISAEQVIPIGQGERMVDLSFLAELPELQKNGEQSEVAFSGTIGLLCCGEDGALLPHTARWEHREQLPCDESTRLYVALAGPAKVTAQPGAAGMEVKINLPVEWNASALQQLPQVAGLELGEENAEKAEGPSLILRRAGGERLWDIAKKSGSTTAAIRQANGLEGEPAPGQMLLIPVE